MNRHRQATNIFRDKEKKHNWNQRTEIFTKEIMLSTKEEKIMPLVEGKMQAGGKEYPRDGTEWRRS